MSSFVEFGDVKRLAVVRLSRLVPPEPGLEVVERDHCTTVCPSVGPPLRVGRGPGAGTARSRLSTGRAAAAQSERPLGLAGTAPSPWTSSRLLPPARSCGGCRGAQGAPVSLRGTRVLGTGWQLCHVAEPQGIPETPRAPETLGATAFWDLDVPMTAAPAFSPRQPLPAFRPHPPAHPGWHYPCLLAGERGGQWGWGPVGRGVAEGTWRPGRGARGPGQREAR